MCIRDRFREAEKEYGYGSFVAEMGAEAIQKLLKAIDLDAERDVYKRQRHCRDHMLSDIQLSISWTKGIRMIREGCVDALQNNKLYYMEEKHNDNSGNY